MKNDNALVFFSFPRIFLSVQFNTKIFLIVYSSEMWNATENLFVCRNLIKFFDVVCAFVYYFV